MGKSITKHIADKQDIIIILIFALLIIFSAFSSYRLGIRPAAAESMDDTGNWYYKYHTKENGWLKMNVSTYVDSHKPVKNQRYNLTSKLPDNVPPNYAIKFKTKNCWVSVSINGNLTYTNIPDTGINPAAYTGAMNHIVPIPSSSAGQNLEITFIPCTNWDTYLIDAISSGDAAQLVKDELWSCALPLLVSAMLIFMGIALFLMGIFERHNRVGKMHMHLGMLSILFGLLSLNHLDLLQLIFGHPIFFYHANILIMALIPYPALQYAILSCEVLPTFRHRAALAISWIEFILIALTYVTGLLPLHYSKGAALIFIHLTIIIAIIYHFRYMAQNKSWKKPTKHVKSLLYILFLFCITIELVIYYFIHSYYPMLVSNYVLFAVVLLSFFTFIRELQAFAQIGRNSEKLKDAAYIDSLTQLGNRTALNRDMEALEQSLSANSSIALIQLDINYLKRTNDVLGHIAGDRLLKNAAQAIHAGFNDYGKCYRFGGDEFVVILIDNPREKYNLGICAMESECERINRGLQKLEHVSIAYGIAYYEPGSDTSLWRVQERADVAMYERKRKMKERSTTLNYKDDRL